MKSFHVRLILTRLKMAISVLKEFTETCISLGQAVADAILLSIRGLNNERARCAGVMRWTFPSVGQRTTPRKRNPSARKMWRLRGTLFRGSDCALRWLYLLEKELLWQH